MFKRRPSNRKTLQLYQVVRPLSCFMLPPFVLLSQYHALGPSTLLRDKQRKTRNRKVKIHWGKRGRREWKGGVMTARMSLCAGHLKWIGWCVTESGREGEGGEVANRLAAWSIWAADTVSVNKYTQNTYKEVRNH